MPFLVLSYLCLGAAIAAGMMAVRSLRLGITKVADRMGMPLSYARILWFFGTIIAWPIGLYVLATGRLVFPTREHAPNSDPSIDKPAKSRARDGITPRLPDYQQQTQNRQSGLEA
ncbi:MAG: hypothetical protein ACR2QH_19375 [Geminicoccaceae bacterium]